MIPKCLPLQRSIVYGPIRSRRFGVSLGINLLPPDLKLCNFDCAYCQYGWTPRLATGKRWLGPQCPPMNVVVNAARKALEQCRRAGRPLDRLTLAGHGEPTLHPDFPVIVRELKRLRNELAPKVPIVALSNSTTIGNARIRGALAELDERHMKLDAGDEELMRRLNGSCLPLDRLVAGLRALRDVTIQAMFVADRSGWINNAGDPAVARWIAALVDIRPGRVHIYTIDRAPAWPFLERVPSQRLNEIARRVRAAGLVAEVF
jgi:wyosine [tRNA(Phe)-imidazoG37] synthetase (radical SAM superfamily)